MSGTCANILTVAVALAVSAGFAAGANAESRGDWGGEWEWAPGPTYKSEDGKFEIGLHGRLYGDFGDIEDDLGAQDRSATEIRAARIGLSGKAWGDFKYKVEVDFSGSEVTLTDALVEYTGWKPLSIIVGHMKEVVSLEESTSSRFTALMERGSFTDAFAIQRRFGVKLSSVHANWRVDVGAYVGSISTGKEGEGHAIAARAAWYPKTGNGGQLHFGTSLRYRDFEDGFNSPLARYRQRPHTHISDERYVDTAGLSDVKSDIFYGLELAAIFGRFWGEAEWAWTTADVTDGMEAQYGGKSSLNFGGGYVGLGWYLTGESRTYKKGRFDRPQVNAPVFEGGWGAWAVVARIDYIDLNDRGAAVFGGEQTTYIIGINWHLNRRVAIKLNYAHSDIDDAFGAPFASGLVDMSGANSVDAITGRLQVDW